MKTYIKWMVGPAAVAALAGGMLVNGGQGIGEVPLTHAAGQGLVTSGLTDLNGHWAKAGIEQALAKGYVDGYEDGSFQPDRQVSRAEFAKMAVAAMKLPVSGSSSGSDWYMGAVNAAVNAGVHKWSDFSTGDWNTPMNRAEMARMAVRAAGQDTDDELKWMYLATKAGLIQGVDDTGSLEVDGTTTRAQAVTIIERILAVKDGREGEIAAQADKHAVNRAEVLWHKTNIFTVMPEFFGSKVLTPWDASKLVVETPDGLYKGEIEKIIAIDFGDPNDPHRNVLGDIGELKWSAGGSKFNVINYPDSYGIVAFRNYEYSSDDTKYGKRGPIFYVNGFTGGRQSEMSKTGELQTFATLEVSKSFSAIGFIIPKHGQQVRNGRLDIQVEAPAIPPTDPQYRDVLSVRGPKVIE